MRQVAVRVRTYMLAAMSMLINEWLENSFTVTGRVLFIVYYYPCQFPRLPVFPRERQICSKGSCSPLSFTWQLVLPPFILPSADTYMTSSGPPQSREACARDKRTGPGRLAQKG